MAQSTGLRYFLFEADGTLRRLPKRTVDGMIRGEDRMLQYAGRRLRAASAWVLFDGGTPIKLLKVEGDWWVFDAQGRTQRGHMEAMRAAMNAAPDYGTGGTGERNGDSFQQRSAQQQLERHWRWTPTPVEVTAIVHAIWPEAAGRPVPLPGFARGQARRRYPVSSKAKYAREKCQKHIWGLSRVIEELGEHDLKGLAGSVDEDGRETGEGTEHLWQGVRGIAEWELRRRKARRTRSGTWYAWVRSMTREAANANLYRSELLEHLACKGRDAAVKASRELLAKHAGKLDHETQIEADVCPEIEWPAHQIPNADDEEDPGIEPHSPLVHPSVIEVDFANDE